MSDFAFLKDKKVLVMGLGVSGRGPGLIQFLKEKGAEVTVTDLKKRRELLPALNKLKGFKVKFVLGRHRAEDFKWADFVVKNPAVPNDSPWLKIARAAGVPIISDAMLFFLGIPAGVKIIGVTGTKGKTTTAILIHKFLAAKFRAHIAGIPGTSYLELLPRVRKNDIVVLELSSFDLEGLAKNQKSPEAAIITNIHSDHLNRYKSFRDYIAAKTNIFKFQSRNGLLFLNKDEKLSKVLAARAPGRVIYFSAREFENKLRFFKNTPWMRVNAANIAAGRKVAKFFGVSDSSIHKILARMRSLPGRLEIVARSRDGIIFVNDTCSTTPFSTAHGIYALRRLYPEKAMVLIAGGEDKKMSFAEIAPSLSELAGAVLLPGSASRKLRRILIRKGIRTYSIFQKRGALEKAILYAREFLIKKGGNRQDQKGGIILFSPAAASFNMFQNEFDRGAKFLAAIKKMVS